MLPPVSQLSIVKDRGRKSVAREEGEEEAVEEREGGGEGKTEVKGVKVDPEVPGLSTSTGADLCLALDFALIVASSSST